MADTSVTCISCQIVYADPAGECHLQLPVFIDDAGACHVSLSPASDLHEDPQEAGRVLSHICLGSCPVADEARRENLKEALGKALSHDEDTSATEKNAHRRFLEGALARLESFDRHSAEAKDVLRRAVISERREAAAQHAQSVPHSRTCFLTYLEQRQLLSSH